MTFSHTTQYAVLSVVFFALSVSIAGFSIYFVNQEGKKLEEQMAVIGKNQLMQERYNNLLQILEQSETEHKQLNNYLLTEGKTINFLSEIEALASDMDLLFSTDSLEVEPLPNPQFEAINLNLRADGEREALISFLSILETLPYFSRVNDLELSAQTGVGNIWSAKINLMVGMHQNDK